jgi:hypothetical protein
MMLNKKIIGIVAGLIAVTGCRTNETSETTTKEIQVEGPAADIDAILEAQTHNGAKVIAYRPCIGISFSDDIEAANQPCSRLTAGPAMIMILEADFLPQLAKDMGVDFVAYQAKEVKDRTGNEVRLTEIERALATTRLLDGQRLKELIGNIDVMKYFRNGMMLGAPSNAEIYDPVMRNRWFAPASAGSYGALIDGCGKSRYTIASQEQLNEHISWLSKDNFLVDIDKGEPKYGHSKFWERLKASKVPSNLKGVNLEGFEMALWVAGDHRYNDRRITFPFVGLTSDYQVGPVEYVPANIILSSYNKEEIDKRIRDYAFATEAQMGGVCFLNKRKLRIGMSFFTKEKDVLKVSSTQYDTPARRSGVRSGDTILSIEGTAIKSFQDFVDITLKWPDGVLLPIKIKRDGKDMIINFDLSK